MRVPPVDTPSTPKTSPMLTGLDWLVPLDFRDGVRLRLAGR